MHGGRGARADQAGQSVASGIAGSIQDRRRAAYVASNARAATAAGGLTTTGTSAVMNEGQIRGEGEYRALTALYQGEDRASELRARASGMRTEGTKCGQDLLDHLGMSSVKHPLEAQAPTFAEQVRQVPRGSRASTAGAIRTTGGLDYGERLIPRTGTASRDYHRAHRPTPVPTPSYRRPFIDESARGVDEAIAGFGQTVERGQ